MQSTLRHRPEFKARYALLLGVLVFAFNLVNLVLLKNSPSTTIISDILSPLVNGFATLGLFLAARHSAEASKRYALPWYLFMAAQACYTIGDIIWAVIELGLKQNPFPSFADFWYLAYYPLFIAGAYFINRRKYRPIDWVMKCLDLGIIMMAAILGFLNFLIFPLFNAIAAEPLLTRVLTLAYPVFDVVLISSIFFLVDTKPKDLLRLPIILLICSAVVMILTDSLFSYQSIVGTYDAGGAIDLGWFVVYILTGLAGYFQAHTLLKTESEKRKELTLPGTETGLQKILSYIPYLWLIFAFSLLNPAWKDSILINKQFLYAGVTLIGVMVVIRQILTLEENRYLNRRLENILGHVQKQAVILEQTNKDLESEIVTRRKAEEQLSYEALHDPLTNLPNRSLLTDRLEEAIEISKNNPDLSYSVLFMDVDQFKVINDSLGHSLGDQLLNVVAQRLQDCLRSSDTAARLGGDEFVILLENSSKSSKEETVAFIVNRLQDQIQQVVDLEGHSVFFTTSIGVVLDVSTYDFPGDVLRDADIAMYRAKALGKDRYEIFHEGLRAQAYTRMEIAEDLHYALENHEFILNFQPIVKLDKFKLMGFESFIRWNHPRYGILLPNDFIPVAEESNLIQSIGEWVMIESCIQTKKWQEKYPAHKGLNVQVNVSGKQFALPQFVSQVSDALDKSNLDPKLLKLEITESILIENFLTNSEKFNQLSELGVQIEIDDFGTGYSSLAYIQNFPIHIIKIDRSFVKDIGKKKKVAELVRAIISMSHDLGMETIAEGIENYDQLNELKRLGCDYGQGFLISDPLSIPMAGALLEGSSRLFPEIKSTERQ